MNPYLLTFFFVFQQKVDRFIQKGASRGSQNTEVENSRVGSEDKPTTIKIMILAGMKQSHIIIILLLCESVILCMSLASFFRGYFCTVRKHKIEHTIYYHLAAEIV